MGFLSLDVRRVCLYLTSDMDRAMNGNAASREQVLTQLRYELGQDVVAAIEDDDIQDIMCNADGKVWVEHRTDGMKCISEMSEVNARKLLGTVAHILDTVCTTESPIVEGVIPPRGARFEGLLPPTCQAPVWSIRKRATQLWTLDDYVGQGVLTCEQREALRDAVCRHQNILIAGGTGSGKTTLANALIHEISIQFPDERLIIIEDTPELQCITRNKVLLETTNTVSMNSLLRAAMRKRPDRILVGEVRGGEALTLLKAWTTGHPGGIATVHASSIEGAALRMQSLAAEAGGPTFSDLGRFIDETLDITIVIQRCRDGSRIVTDIGNHTEIANA